MLAIKHHTSNLNRLRHLLESLFPVAQKGENESISSIISTLWKKSKNFKTIPLQEFTKGDDEPQGRCIKKLQQYKNLGKQFMVRYASDWTNFKSKSTPLFWLQWVQSFHSLWLCSFPKEQPYIEGKNPSLRSVFFFATMCHPSSDYCCSSIACKTTQKSFQFPTATQQCNKEMWFVKQSVKSHQVGKIPTHPRDVVSIGIISRGVVLKGTDGKFLMLPHGTTFVNHKTVQILHCDYFR